MTNTEYMTTTDKAAIVAEFETQALVRLRRVSPALTRVQVYTDGSDQIALEAPAFGDLEGAFEVLESDGFRFKHCVDLKGRGARAVFVRSHLELVK